MRCRRAPRVVLALSGLAMGVGAVTGSVAADASSAVAAPSGAAAPSTSCSSQSGQSGGSTQSGSSAQTVATPPPALSELQSETAWAQTAGLGVVVAVVDSGVDAANPHLKDALAGGVDLVGDGQGDNGYADLDGRGTAIAGIVAARKVAGSGVEGLAPAARILSVRVYSGGDDQSTQAGTGPSVARLAAGIRAAVDQRAQIIDVSFSTGVDDPLLRSAVAYAAAHGSLVVASTGNTDGSLAIETTDAGGTRYPAADPGAIGVAATNANGTPSSSSVHGADVELAAPGSGVVSAANGGVDCSFDGTDSAWATGYVSAAAALVASAHPDETPAEWAYRLEATAVRPDPDARDDGIGWGVVQPYDAIALVPGADVRGPANPFTGTAAGAGPAPDDQRVALRHRASAQADSLLIAVIVAAAGGTLLGAIAIVGLLRRRRRRDTNVAVRDDGRPLMGPAPSRGVEG